MDKDFTNFYKLNIAHDLIMFLINVQVSDLPPAIKTERANLILNAWEKRLDIKLKELSEENLESIATSEGIDIDIARILSDAHQTGPETIRKEFKTEIRDTIFKSFEEMEKS